MYKNSNNLLIQTNKAQQGAKLSKGLKKGETRSECMKCTQMVKQMAKINEMCQVGIRNASKRSNVSKK